MTLHPTELWRRITAYAAADCTHAAYIEQVTGRTLTYGELADFANDPSVTAGSANASPVVLPGGNTIEFVRRFITALLAGRATLPVAADTKAAEIERLVQSLDEIDPRSGSCLLLITSGTTGVPKIVRRTMASLDAVSSAMADAIGFSAADRVIAAVPLVHSYGLEHGLLAPLWAGSTVMLCDGLDLPSLLMALADGATILPAVPSMIELLAQLSATIPTPALRRVYTAGAPLPPAVAALFEARFCIPVGQVYGSTEIGSVVYRDPALCAAESVGRAMNGVSIRVLSTDDSRRSLTLGNEGEIAIRSPSMLAGFVGEPALLIDGHFPTGDLGRLSTAGDLTLTGRLRLLIDVGGAKVNPLEVERIFESHPEVAACVVLPLRLSETVCKIKAIIIPTDPQNPPAISDLRDHARPHLASYKLPRVIEFRADLPRTATGKIARQQLEVPECEA